MDIPLPVLQPPSSSLLYVPDLPVPLQCEAALSYDVPWTPAGNLEWAVKNSTQTGASHQFRCKPVKSSV